MSWISSPPSWSVNAGPPSLLIQKCTPITRFAKLEEQPAVALNLTVVLVVQPSHHSVNSFLIVSVVLILLLPVDHLLVLQFLVLQFLVLQFLLLQLFLQLLLLLRLLQLLLQFLLLLLLHLLEVILQLLIVHVAKDFGHTATSMLINRNANHQQRLQLLLQQLSAALVGTLFDLLATSTLTNRDAEQQQPTPHLLDHQVRRKNVLGAAALTLMIGALFFLIKASVLLLNKLVLVVVKLYLSDNQIKFKKF